MKYSIEKHEKYSLVNLSESKLNTLIAPELKSELVTLFQSGTQNLILDLSETSYVDSSGLSAVLIANRLAAEAGGIFVLTGVKESVMNLITITKLSNVLTILPTVAEAREAVFLNELERDLGEEEGD